MGIRNETPVHPDLEKRIHRVVIKIFRSGDIVG